jgi:uncharacterized BrkB/YihY/UPF0761 family membrane protein
MPSLWKFGGLTPILLAQHAFKKLGDHELSTRSAALSYYFILALFPMLCSPCLSSEFLQVPTLSCAKASSPL